MKADLDGLIAMDTLKSADGKLLWPDAAFQALLKIADSPAAAVAGGARIKLPDEARSISAWRIAAIRVDPSAPGTSDAIIKKFGSAPQIRLILQPVNTNTGRPRDIAVHVIYSFISGVTGGEPNAFPQFVPDQAKFQRIVNDLVHLKQLTAKGPEGVDTSALPLGVHPGLGQAHKGPELVAAVRAFLTTHLPEGTLRAMAIMGLPSPNPEPWIFVAIVAKSDGTFQAAPGFNVPATANTAQMISFVSADNVMPSPITNNRAPITDMIIVPTGQRRGVATAPLFADADLDAPATIGTDADGKPILDPTARNRDIPDIIANPDEAHFFNADCASCHTETTRTHVLQLDHGSFAFKDESGSIPKISDDVGPGKDVYNVRNIGWGPGPGEMVPTVTQRTANETAAAVAFINKNYLAPPAPPETPAP